MSTLTSPIDKDMVNGDFNGTAIHGMQAGSVVLITSQRFDLEPAPPFAEIARLGWATFRHEHSLDQPVISHHPELLIQDQQIIPINVGDRDTVY